MIKNKIQKILVPLDGSKNSFRGLDETIIIARNCQVEYGVDMEFTNTASDNAMMNMNMPHETHMVLITELTPNTNYDFRFKATLDDQTFYSDVKSFTTPDM